MSYPIVIILFLHIFVNYYSFAVLSNFLNIHAYLLHIDVLHKNVHVHDENIVH